MYTSKIGLPFDKLQHRTSRTIALFATDILAVDCWSVFTAAGHARWRMRRGIKAVTAESRLDLFGPPASSLGLSHVAWRLNRGDELENDIGDANDTNDATSNVVEDHFPEKKAAEEDVDWKDVRTLRPAWESRRDYLQAPRPTKEKRKEAKRGTCGGIWNSGPSQREAVYKID